MGKLSRNIMLVLFLPISVAGFLVRLFIYAWSVGDLACDEFMTWFAKQTWKK